MAVETTATDASFIGTGVLSTYAPEFYINTSDQVVVTVNGVLQTLGDDYVVNNVGAAAGCDIVATFAAGADIYIERATPRNQLVDTQNNETILEDVLDATFDKLTMIAQELGGVSDRAVAMPKGESGIVLPVPAGRASRFVSFDINGDLFMSSGTGADAALRTDLGSSIGVNLVGGAVSGIRAVTDKFITNIDGAVIPKVGDRLFVGGANKNDGNYPNDNPANQDWYTFYERAQGRGNGIIVSSQMAVLTNNYAGAAVAGIFAARTSNLGPTVGGAVGLEAHVVNDNATVPHDAWALYSEATRDSEGVGSIITYEADARNKGSYHAVTPWNQNAKQSVVHQIASGGALTGVGCDDVSAGINFRHNPTKFGAGIVFGNSSIRGTDGATGYGNAILFGIRQRLTWMNSADAEVTNVASTVTNVANKNGIEFNDSGTLFLGPTNNVSFLVSATANAANYIAVTAGVAGVAPHFDAVGSDANIDIKLTPKGGGTLAIGNAANFVANGAGTPVFTGTLPAGLSTTVKKWLAIHDHTGAFFVIPLFGV